MDKDVQALQIVIFVQIVADVDIVIQEVEVVEYAVVETPIIMTHQKAPINLIT